jgi:betaine-aldehyde dehydrogenase
MAIGGGASDLKLALAQPCFNNNYIGGQWVESSSGDTYETISPTTETCVHRCPASTSVDVQAAVAAARNAADAGYDEWGGLSATDRAQYLLALATKLSEHAAFIAELEARDVGKPLIDAHGDIMRCISEIEECVTLAAQLDAMQNTVVYQSADVLGLRRWDPVGVVACITPWNFPLLVTIMKLAPALTAGNTVVLKPSEYSPLTTLFAARLCDEVGFPAGVVNVISGTGSCCGAPLSQSQGIDMVSFTGSVPTGSAIMGEAAKNIVKPLLELGGKSPSVVFEDVDLDKALPWVMSGFLSNTGRHDGMQFANKCVQLLSCI